MSEIGFRLKYIRVSRRLTIEKISKIIGVSKMSISNWENGLRNPKSKYIKKYAEYFGISEDWIIYGEKNLENNLNKRLSSLEAKIDKVLELLQSKE